MSDMKVDRKLAHIVKRMLNANDPNPPNLDYFAQVIRLQHREYLRQGADEFRANVETAYQYLVSPPLPPPREAYLQKQLQQHQAATAASSRKKRAAQQQMEESYDAAASQEEVIRQQANVGGGLNASLLKNYKQKQELEAVEKQQQEAQNQKETNGKTKATESTPKKRRKASKSPFAGSGSSGLDNEPPPFLTPVPRPKERYSDLGGMDTTVQEIRQLVEYPLIRPELYQHLGIDPPRGVLLRGPPGTGKSHLANAVAGELGVNYFRVSAPELVSGMSGESEGRIRDLFKAASDLAPSVIFLDEIDAVAPKRDEGGSSRGMEKRMVAQLLTSMDSIAPEKNRNRAAVVVLAATNRPDSLDSALRRAGRFDREILLGVPDEDAREKILKSMTAGMRLAGDFDFRILARKTPGFVGADVRSLTKEAAVLAINRIFRDVLVEQQAQQTGENGESSQSNTDNLTPLSPEQMDPLYVTMNDFLEAVPSVQPSSKREGFATVPGVSWDDIGALQRIREELTISVLEPIRHPEKFKALGLTLPAGVLLYGPPGCGKVRISSWSEFVIPIYSFLQLIEFVSD